MVFHNVVTMTKAIQRAEADGHQVSDEVLAALSPFATEHNNRFGKHVLNFSRNPEPATLDFRKAPGRESSILTPPGIRKMGDTHK